MTQQPGGWRLTLQTRRPSPQHSSRRASLSSQWPRRAGMVRPGRSRTCDPSGEFEHPSRAGGEDDVDPVVAAVEGLIWKAARAIADRTTDNQHVTFWREGENVSWRATSAGPRASRARTPTRRSTGDEHGTCPTPAQARCARSEPGTRRDETAPSLRACSRYIGRMRRGRHYRVRVYPTLSTPRGWPSTRMSARPDSRSSVRTR
jgi:hypothetical protein